MNIDIQSIIHIAQYAGNNFLIPNWGKVARETKDDGSPVTVVDKLISKYIIDALCSLTPEIPVISEEASTEENILAMQNPLRWVVDPLDGTATYLDGPKLGKGAGFGVHIALVNCGRPEIGVCYFPAQEKIYFTDNDGKAYYQVAQKMPVELEVSQEIKNAVVRASVPWKVEQRPHDINGKPYQPVPAVGGEEVCLVACGDADVIWHDRPDKEQPMSKREVFSHWDIAASHAILRAAGGELYEISTGKIITYCDQNFIVLPCVGGHSKMLEAIGYKLDL